MLGDARKKQQRLAVLHGRAGAVGKWPGKINMHMLYVLLSPTKKLGGSVNAWKFDSSLTCYQTPVEGHFRHALSQ